MDGGLDREQHLLLSLYLMLAKYPELIYPHTHSCVILFYCFFIEAFKKQK